MDYYYSKCREDLIRKFKNEMRCWDIYNERAPSLTNAPNPLKPQLCHIRRITQTGFLHQMIQNYLSEIRDGYNNIGGRPLLDVENELYDNTKDWGNKGYLSEGYVDLASTLQREAQPVGSIGSCIFQTVAFVVKAMTGVTIVITDFPQRVEVNNRINRLINELCADLSIFMPVEGEYMVNHDLSCPTENRYFIDFKNFMNEDGNHVKRELDRKFPHGPPLLLDFATLRKEIAQRRKRVQTYQREDAETDASQS